mgnify:CR=1 FL=1
MVKMGGPMMPCGKHEEAEAETAVFWDGVCPLCQAHRIVALEEALDNGRGDE